MQSLQPAFRIEETERKDSLLEVVSDKYCRSIIEPVISKPKSAQEITIETKIPISTIYRRIQTLYDNKLLQTSGMISEDGKNLLVQEQNQGNSEQIWQRHSVS